MGSAPRALIDHAALRHNLQRVRTLAPDSRVWAVIKANAYGHGLLRVAGSLGQADGFAVARTGEALELRAAGFTKPILLLEGMFSSEELEQALAHDLTLTLHHHTQLDQIESAALTEKITVWVKVDTGMHRLGFRVEEVKGVMERLASIPSVDVAGLMTHLANADERMDELTLSQCERFRALPDAESQVLSIANSGGLLGWPCAHSDWVRPGIMLYGASPFGETTGEDEGLMPVMTLQAGLIAVRHCKKGEAIGYSGTYVCPEDMPVGVVCVGYGDGYPRHAPSGTPVWLNGRRVPLVGRVSMDMITLDLRACPYAKVGDIVTLWGQDLPIELVARSAGTIAYQLLCNVTSRVEFVDLNPEEETRYA